MATNPVQPPVPAAPPPTEHHFDELSGVYGFFRRHQKKVLYTAGLFTLLTFSITGPMMSVTNEIFGTRQAMPSIMVNGKRVSLQAEDYTYGTTLAKNLRHGIPFGVLPGLDPGDGNQSQAGDVYAILRRAAIAEGFEFSYVEVDKAIAQMRELYKAESAAKMARDMSFPSLAEYRAVVGEAMRIGTYVKLQTLALDSTEARVLDQVTSDREKITFHVATFDEKKLEDELKAASTLKEEELRTWVEAKDEREKRTMQAYDPPLTKLTFAALLTAEGQFTPEQWKDTYLKDYTVGDDQLNALYEQEKENRFKADTPEKYKPFDDATVKAELTRLAQAEHVMNQVLSAVRGKQTESLKSQTDEVSRTQGELGSAQTQAAELDGKSATKANELTAKEAELAKTPDDAALKTAVETLRTEAQQAKDAAFAANEKVPALKTAMKAAEEAVKEARARFDFAAAVAELTKDKTGIVVKSMPELKTAEDMKDLDKLGLDLGTWPNSVQAANPRTAKGDLGFMPGRTSKAVVIYQVADANLTPLKPWDKLKPIAEGAYWTEQAKKQAEEKKKKMEEALLRLAKAKIADKVAEIEGKKQARVDEKVQAWETETKAALAIAEKTLQEVPAGSQMRATWQQEVDRRKAELGRKEQMRTMHETQIAAAIEAEIATEAKKHHRDVLDAAAAEAGFTVTDVGPLARDLPERDPRFDKNPDHTVVFLMRGHAKLKDGEATGLVQDFTNRRYHAAVVTKIEPVGNGDVTRRDFETLRTGNGAYSFAAQQAGIAYFFGFTLEALTKRYDLQRPVGEQREEAKADPKADPSAAPKADTK